MPELAQYRRTEYNPYKEEVLQNTISALERMRSAAGNAVGQMKDTAKLLSKKAQGVGQ